MIFWVTNNTVCQSVARFFEYGGAEVRHITQFSHDVTDKHIFYGLLRGAGSAIKICQHEKVDFYYIDNGYFNAEYINASGKKHMSGTYRVVKNALVHTYEGPYDPVDLDDMRKPLVLPPSEYSAYFYDTTPPDWLDEMHWLLGNVGKVRRKGDASPLDDDIMNCDFVVSFNSMAIMRAAELGKPIGSFYGCVYEPGFYDYRNLLEYFSDKQFTLEQVARGKWMN